MMKFKSMNFNSLHFLDNFFLDADYKINNKYKTRMQMKINFQKIFGSAKTEETVLDSPSEPPPQSQIESTQSLGLRYTLHMALFEEDNEQQKIDHKVARKHVFKTGSVKESQVDDIRDNFPGERLYYQSQKNIARRKQQLERIQYEKIIDEQKQMTFKPSINKNSQKILQMKKNKQTMERKRKTRPQEEPTEVKINRQQLKQCTFKPMLISKSNSFLKTRGKEKVFDQLFHDHKLKEYKNRLIIEEESSKKKVEKKANKVKFDDFLHRNEEFMNKVQKKQQLIAKTSKNYDLNSGKKMFVPETCTTPKSAKHKKYFQTFSDTKKQEDYIPKSIFGKNPSIDDSQANNFINHERKSTERISFEDQLPINEVEQHLEEQIIAKEEPIYIQERIPKYEELYHEEGQLQTNHPVNAAEQKAEQNYELDQNEEEKASSSIPEPRVLEIEDELQEKQKSEQNA